MIKQEILKSLYKESYSLVKQQIDGIKHQTRTYTDPNADFDAFNNTNPD